MLSNLWKEMNIYLSCYRESKPISRKFGFDRGTPIDRYYIDKFMKANSHLIKKRVLEIADSYYSRRFGGKKVTKYEVLHVDKSNKSATIIGNLTDVDSLLEEIIDCFICTQTFNCIYDLKSAVEGSYYLLKSDGVLLATIPGISQISRYDMDRWGDYWRLTTASAKKLFEEVFGEGNVKIYTYGNVMAATGFLQGLAVEDLPNKKLLDKHDRDYEVLIGIVARKVK